MAETDATKLKVMVVDDETDNLDLLYRTFRREFEVFRANTAFKALEILEREGEMGIIISDQRMPKMSGTELLSRTVDRFPDTIRILLTGYTDAEDLVDAINTGKVFKYITKPWSPEQLKIIVYQAAETYRMVKQRTNELHRALRRESLFNAVTTAIRESLDYRSMLQTIVETIGRTFAADLCVLYPIEPATGSSGSTLRFSKELFTYAASLSPPPLISPSPHPLTSPSLFARRQIQLIQSSPADPAPFTQLLVPLTYQQEALAALILYKQGTDHPWSAEERQLIEGVAEQAALAISQAKLYQRIQKQTEQMRAELAVARQIQMNLLRQSWPELDCVRVQAYCYPAREVGGDFFEVYVHPQGDVWLAVGDVSGKGVPAALFMASALSLLRRELLQETSPEPNIVMRHLNTSLSNELVGSNCFITMVLARYTPATYRLVYANAGHVYPLVWSHRQVMARSPAAPAVEPTYLQVRGVPLGILPVWQAAAGDLTLDSGQVLLLISDGITEATVAKASANATDRPMLKQAGLWQLLIQEQGALNLNRLLSKIRTVSQIQEDDQTILSLEVL